MFVFKAINGNLFYSTESGDKQLNNENYLDASRLNKGLMTSDHVRRMEEVEAHIRTNLNGVTINVDNPDALTSLISSNRDISMYYRDNHRLNMADVQLSDIEPMPKPSWSTWNAGTGYFHTYYSVNMRSYLIKKEIPSTLTTEEKKVLFLEIEVSTEDTPIEVYVMYENGTSSLVKKVLQVGGGETRKRFIVGLEDINERFYIYTYGNKFGFSKLNLYKLGTLEGQDRKGGTYNQIPRLPIVGQTYYCVNYPFNNSTKEVLLVYNGTEWKQIDIVV